ncbi:MAG TPA: SIMPL domain-containing protein [Actinomycetota bacterium]|nr:SIMPL domain-containing protein [Actinomycetota bacterium]
MKPLAFAGALVVAVLLGTAGAAGASSEATVQHSIVVTGQGSVSTVPDRAQVSFGVSTDAKTASAALRANAVEMTKVIAAVKGEGVAAADIKTDLVSLSPRYSQNGDTVVGYTATNSVSATIRNLAKIGGTIDAAVDAGANQVSGPNLVRGDMTALYRAALRAAIANAKGKAQTIAAASGLHLRRITDVSEASSAPVPQPLTKAGADAATPVEPGTQLVEAAVTVTFAVG